jgi:glycolate oxidase
MEKTEPRVESGRQMSDIDRRRALAVELRRVVPSDRVSIDPADLIVYGYDGTWLENPAFAVVSPRSTDEVSAVVRRCRLLGYPLVPRGAGSGLAGGSVPGRDSVVLNLVAMPRVLSIDKASRQASVEAGVINADLQARVEAEGLFYPPDPASLKQSTIGGNVATSASGPRCLKYGGTREYVTGVVAVTPAGDVVRLGSCCAQPGLDDPILHLLIGSEGTLGVVCEVDLRLIERPSAVGTALAVFDELDCASAAVSAILGSGVVPVALEMMDRTTLRCVEQHLKAGLPTDADAVLIVECDGLPEDVDAQVDAVVAACETAGARSVEHSRETAARDRLWKARRSTSSSFGRLRPNKLGEDISVPRSAIPETVRRIQAIAESENLVIPQFGHIGDGNLHPNILCDLRDRAEMKRVQSAAERIFGVALALGGTLSGEHGIGLLKRGFLSAAIDSPAVEAMARLKQALDPTASLNPGKVLPGPAATG